jgi:hypothetical protein
VISHPGSVDQAGHVNAVVGEKTDGDVSVEIDIGGWIGGRERADDSCSPSSSIIVDYVDGAVRSPIDDVTPVSEHSGRAARGRWSARRQGEVLCGQCVALDLPDRAADTAKHDTWRRPRRV